MNAIHSVALLIGILPVVNQETSTAGRKKAIRPPDFVGPNLLAKWITCLLRGRHAQPEKFLARDVPIWQGSAGR